VVVLLYTRSFGGPFLLTSQQPLPWYMQLALCYLIDRKNAIARTQRSNDKQATHRLLPASRHYFTGVEAWLSLVMLVFNFWKGAKIAEKQYASI
jgi:hypothetical protein